MLQYSGDDARVEKCQQDGVVQDDFRLAGLPDEGSGWADAWGGYTVGEQVRYRREGMMLKELSMGVVDVDKIKPQIS